jgi:hypothetical protein
MSCWSQIHCGSTTISLTNLSTSIKTLWPAQTATSSKDGQTGAYSIGIAVLVRLNHRYRKRKIDCSRFVMCPLLAPGFQGFFFSFLLRPLTVLLKQTRQGVRSIKHLYYLDVYGLNCAIDNNKTFLTLVL